MMQRESEFPSPLQAKLTGIALDPNGREFADQVLDAYWSDEPRQQDTLNSVALSSSSDREVIIGSGFHAAVYAATRVLSGYPKPLVLERNERVGGTFAMTARPTFYLNSRNRPGRAGLAGDQGAALNYLPGAPIQAANVSMAEYQTNTDMAFVIRLALAQFADVVTNATGPVRLPRRNRGADRDCRTATRCSPAGSSTRGDWVIRATRTSPTAPRFSPSRSSWRAWPPCGRCVVCVGSRSSVVVTQPSAPSSRCWASRRSRSWPPPRWTAWSASTGTPSSCRRPASGGGEEIRGRYQAIGRYLRTGPSRRAAPERCWVAGSSRSRCPDRDSSTAAPTTWWSSATGNRETDIDGLDFADLR